VFGGGGDWGIACALVANEIHRKKCILFSFSLLRKKTRKNIHFHKGTEKNLY
jgi:hypothetical protein